MLQEEGSRQEGEALGRRCPTSLRSPPLSLLTLGAQGTEECATGSDCPQGQEGPSGGGRGVCNCQGSRGLGRALGASAWSPHAGQLWGGCGPTGVTAGPRLDGRREVGGWCGGEVQVMGTPD